MIHERPELTRYERRTLIAMLELLQQGRYPTYPNIAEQSGLKASTSVQYHMRSLIRKGYVMAVTDYNPRGTRNRRPRLWPAPVLEAIEEAAKQLIEELRSHE